MKLTTRQRQIFNWIKNDLTPMQIEAPPMLIGKDKVFVFFLQFKTNAMLWYTLAQDELQARSELANDCLKMGKLGEVTAISSSLVPSKEHLIRVKGKTFVNGKEVL